MLLGMPEPISNYGLHCKRKNRVPLRQVKDPEAFRCVCFRLPTVKQSTLQSLPNNVLPRRTTHTAKRVQPGRQC